MWTFRYKGHWIHGYCDRDECRVQGPDSKVWPPVISLHAAKCLITRRQKAAA